MTKPMTKLEYVCNAQSSNIAQKDLVGNSGSYPIYGASGLIKYVDFYKLDQPYIAVVKDGAGVGRVMKLPAKSSVIGTLQYIIPNNNVDIRYLAYAMEHMNLSKYYTGATIPHIYFRDYKEERLTLPPHSEQMQQVEVLDQVCDLIAKHQQQLSKLDELVKSRFIELFGDPAWNPMELPVVPMTELCSIIDGDRGKNYPKQEEFSEDGHCLFLNAKNVTANGFCFDNCMFITEDKDSILRNGKLTRGDVVLTTRGTVGNLAFYDDTIPFDHVRINSGMVILRLKKDSICETFFIEQFKMQLQTIKERVLSGSAQPQLPISTMNQIKMLVPPLETQTKFAAFVEQADKLKFEVKQSLEKLETLKKSLMQEYFG